jgi:hypothetical protein
MLRQSEAITPENRIQSFRESSLEMNGVEEKITSLKELLVQTNRGGGLFGLTGGMQAVTLWGIVLIVLAGFTFLIVYLNALRSEARLKKSEEKAIVADALEKHDQLYHPAPKYRHREVTHHRGQKIARIASLVLLVSGFGSVAGSLAIKTVQSRPVALVSPSPDAVVLGTTSDDKLPREVPLLIPNSGSVPVRHSPSITAAEIMSLKDINKVFVFRLIDNWALVGLSAQDSDKGWWINTEYLELE